MDEMLSVFVTLPGLILHFLTNLVAKRGINVNWLPFRYLLRLTVQLCLQQINTACIIYSRSTGEVGKCFISWCFQYIGRKAFIRMVLEKNTQNSRYKLKENFLK